jgi:integrase
MRGNITRRGKHSWWLKFDVGTADGKRETRYVTVRGRRQDAERELARLIASVGTGSYVEPSKAAVGDFVRARVDQWEAAGDITARTAQRYKQLTTHQIVPHLGNKELQKLTRLDVEGWHTVLRNDGLAARTIGHAHKVLGKALSDAERDGAVVKNVCRLQKAPRVVDQEMIFVRDVPAFVEKLRGSAFQVPALLGLLCGMRLGEVLALRWSRVDLDGKVIQIREALEQTKAHGIRFKPPKSKAGRRDITMPDNVVDALRAYRRSQLELRMQLGIGRLRDDALLFTDTEGNPRSLYAASAAWRVFAKSIGMPDVTFHALRHSHASQLIHEGVDIVTISKRLGHAKPDITLRVYAHLFHKDDGKAAATINAALNR